MQLRAGTFTSQGCVHRSAHSQPCGGCRPALSCCTNCPPCPPCPPVSRPPPRSDTALMNASYTLQAPHVTSQQSFWRFALQDLKQELSRAYSARKVAGGQRCVAVLAPCILCL